MHKIKQGNCQKCSTKFTEVKEFDGRWLGIPCGCYDEEKEKASEKHIRDEEKLEEYRQLCAGTIGIPPSSSE